MHLSHFHLTRLQELPTLFTSHTLSLVARSLVGIFIPIYLFQLGFSLTEIFLFFFGFYLADVPFRFYGPRLLVKIGAHKSMVVGLAGSFAFFILLAKLAAHPGLLWAIIPLGGVSSFYWLGFHAIFSASLSRQKVGRLVSLMSLVILITSSLAPAIGGIVATLFGPPALYVAAAILFLLAAAVLVTSRDTVQVSAVNWKQVPWRSIKQDLIANASTGVISNSIETLVWPLFIFFLIPSYAGVGGLSAILVLSSALVTVYVGKREESKGEAHYMKQGSLVYGLTNLLRPLVASSTGVFGANLFAGAGKSYLQVAYSSRYYKNSQRYSPIEYIAAMELALSVANALFCLLLAALAIFAPNKIVLIVGLLAAVPLSYGINRMR